MKADNPEISIGEIVIFIVMIIIIICMTLFVH